MDLLFELLHQIDSGSDDIIFSQTRAVHGRDLVQQLAVTEVGPKNLPLCHQHRHPEVVDIPGGSLDELANIELTLA